MPINDPLLMSIPDWEDEIFHLARKKDEEGYKRIAKLLRKAAEEADASRKRVMLDTSTVRAIANVLPAAGRKKKRGPQVDRFEKLYFIGGRGEALLCGLREKYPRKKYPHKSQIDLEMEVAAQLGINHSDFKKALAMFRRFKRKIEAEMRELASVSG